MTLFKTDIDLAGHYVARSYPSGSAGFPRDAAASSSSRSPRSLRITGEEELLAANPVLQRTLAVRDDYLGPLHYLQVALTARLRADRRRRQRARPGARPRAAADRERHRGRHAQHRLTPRLPDLRTFPNSESLELVFDRVFCTLHFRGEYLIRLPASSRIQPPTRLAAAASGRQRRAARLPGDQGRDPGDGRLPLRRRRTASRREAARGGTRREPHPRAPGARAASITRGWCASSRVAACTSSRKSKAEIIEMITAWAALESMAARLICERGTDEDIGEPADALHDVPRTASCGCTSTSTPRPTSASISASSSSAARRC